MKYVNKMKKKWQKSLTGIRRQKPSENFGRKTTKIGLESGSVEEREGEKNFLKSLKK